MLDDELVLCHIRVMQFLTHEELLRYNYWAVYFGLPEYTYEKVCAEEAQPNGTHCLVELLYEHCEDRTHFLQCMRYFYEFNTETPNVRFILIDFFDSYCEFKLKFIYELLHEICILDQMELTSDEYRNFFLRFIPKLQGDMIKQLYESILVGPRPMEHDLDCKTYSEIFHKYALLYS